MIQHNPYPPRGKSEEISPEALEAINNITDKINDIDYKDGDTATLLFLVKRGVAVMAICRERTGWEEVVDEWLFSYKHRDNILEVTYPEGDTNGHIIFGDINAEESTTGSI